MPAASLSSLPELNSIFSLDCFHFTDMKKVIQVLIDNVKDLDTRMNNLDHKVGTLDIPDTKAIMKKIEELSKNQLASDMKITQVKDSFDSFSMTINNTIDEYGSMIESL